MGDHLDDYEELMPQPNYSAQTPPKANNDSIFPEITDQNKHKMILLAGGIFSLAIGFTFAFTIGLGAAIGAAVALALAFVLISFKVYYDEKKKSPAQKKVASVAKKISIPEKELMRQPAQTLEREAETFNKEALETFHGASSGAEEDFVPEVASKNQLSVNEEEAFEKALSKKPSQNRSPVEIEEDPLQKGGAEVVRPKFSSEKEEPIEMKPKNAGGAKGPIELMQVPKNESEDTKKGFAESSTDMEVNTPPFGLSGFGPEQNQR